MKRWRRIGLVVFLALAMVLTVLILGTRRGPRFIDSIVFLRGAKGQHSSFLLSDPLPRRAITADIQAFTDTFLLDEPFQTLSETAKKELNPRTKRVSAFPPKNPTLIIYEIKDPSSGNAVSVSVQEYRGRKTMVNVQEMRQATWMDRAKDWIANVFHPKEAIHY